MPLINRFRGYARSTAFCILLCLFASPGFALECGDVLGPGGTYEMDADLQCDLPQSMPSLRLSGGVKLNMHDHTLTCLADLEDGGTGFGIRLDGSGNEVSGGNIESCGVAVELGGDGGHLVSQLNVTGGNQQLLRILSNHNVVQDVVASRGDEAFVVFGDENIVTHNQSLSVDGNGFVVNGNRNRVTNNSTTSSVCSGFEANGVNNLLADNEAIGTLLCETFSVLGTGNVIERNTVRNSGRDGFFVRGNDNMLHDNGAMASALSGIHVLNGFTGNQIIRNVASGNAQFDLQDDNPNCDHNIWSANQFGTANARCVSANGCTENLGAGQSKIQSQSQVLSRIQSQSRSQTQSRPTPIHQSSPAPQTSRRVVVSHKANHAQLE